MQTAVSHPLSRRRLKLETTCHIYTITHPFQLLWELDILTAETESVFQLYSLSSQISGHTFLWNQMVVSVSAYFYKLDFQSIHVSPENPNASQEETQYAELLSHWTYSLQWQQIMKCLFWISYSNSQRNNLQIITSRFAAILW